MPANSTISSSAEVARPVGPPLSFLHAVIIFLITTLGGYLQFQYQSQKKSLLEEHGKFMVAIYANLFMYGMGLIAEYKLQTSITSRCLSVVERFTPSFGILVVVLITTLLNPDLGLVALVIWALVTLVALIKLFEEILQWLRPRLIRAREILTTCFNRAENPSPGVEENESARVEANDLSEENDSPV